MNREPMHLVQHNCGMLFNREFEEVIHQNNLFDFDRVMNFRGGEVIKHTLKERTTIRFILSNGKNP